MADELEVLWKKLSFTEEEDERLVLGSNNTKAAKELGKNCLIMKVLSCRSIVLKTYVNIELANLLTKRNLLVIR